MCLPNRIGCNPDSIRRVSDDAIGLQPRHQPLHILGLRRVSAKQPVVAEQPQVARLCDRVGGRLGNLVLDNFFFAVLVEVRSFSEVGVHLLQPFASGVHLAQQGIKSDGVRLGKSRKRVKRKKQLVGLSLVNVEHQHGHLLLGRCLSPEVPIHKHQRAVRKLAGQQGIGIANLGQNATQGILLGLGMRAPVLWVGDKLGSFYPTKLADSVADLHDEKAGSPPM